MRKLSIFLATLGGLIFTFSYSYAKTWTCYRYVDGKPTGGFIKVEAETKEEAEKKSYNKYKKELNYNLDYTKCYLSI